jgi:CRISPR/Cas system-associated exonuclease Cas4 (RecB family)
MADPLVLSGSSINTYLRCAKQWEYAYVMRIRQPPTLRIAVGSAGHTVIETDLRQKLWTEQDLPLEQVQEEFRDEFVKESEDAEDTEKETKGQALDSGVKAISMWHSTIAPKTLPSLVEEQVQYSLNDVIINGTIDIVHADGRIGDWKFTSKSPSTKGDAGYLLSLVGYAIGYRHKTGRVETGLVLDHIVRTKEPKHVPVSSPGPVPDASILAYAGIVEDVAKGITGGYFPPTGLQGSACSWCGYRNICPAFRAASAGDI